MDATLHALGGILLRAIPTLLVVILLHLYLKGVFFGPLKKILKQREEATSGARAAAEASAKTADAKSAEYAAAIQQARSDIYKEQEESRKKWLADQARQLTDARAAAHQSLNAARGSIEAEAAAARRDLEAHSAELAEQIAARLLEGRAA